MRQTTVEAIFATMLISPGGGIIVYSVNGNFHVLPSAFWMPLWYLPLGSALLILAIWMARVSAAAYNSEVKRPPDPQPSARVLTGTVTRVQRLSDPEPRVEPCRLLPVAPEHVREPWRCRDSTARAALTRPRWSRSLRSAARS